MLPYVKQVGAMELIANGSWETYCSSPSGMWLDYVEAMEMEGNAWIKLTWKREYNPKDLWKVKERKQSINP